MRALLVSPAYPDTYWSLSHMLPLVRRRWLVAPLPLLTVAALLPRDPTPPRGVLPAVSLADLGVVVRSVWRQGVRGSYRGAYFRFLGWTLRHHPRKLALALAQACAGHHFLTYTRETVVPRLRATLEEEDGGTGWPARGLVA